MFKKTKFFFILLLFFLIFFTPGKSASADCQIKNSKEHIQNFGEYYFKASNGNKICQFSPISSGKNSYCYGVSKINENIIQLNDFSECSIEKVRADQNFLKPEFGNYFECVNNRWEIKEGSGICYMVKDESKFWQNLNNNILGGNVANLMIENYQIPTSGLSPMPVWLVGQKKCVVPDKVDFWGNVKSLVPNVRLNFNEAYCLNQNGRDVIYVCNEKAKKVIKMENNEEFFLAVEKSNCQSVLGQVSQCNFYNVVKKADEIFCQVVENNKCDATNEDCLSFCPEETHFPHEGKYCGKIKNGRYEGVCCRRKIDVELGEDVIPLLTCGNGEAKLGEKSKRCCPLTSKNTFDSVNPFLSFLEKIPIVGGSSFKTIRETLDRAKDIQNKTTYNACYIGYPSTPNNLNDPQCLCLSQLEITPTPFQSVREMCERYLLNLEGRFTKENENCKSCAKQAGMWTAFGCLRGNFSDFIKFNILGTALSLAGLFAILCIIYSAIILQTSAGNPEKIKKAQELLTSCIMGLVLIIFSVFLLKLIGVDILKIPGFGK